MTTLKDAKLGDQVRVYLKVVGGARYVLSPIKTSSWVRATVVGIGYSKQDDCCMLAWKLDEPTCGLHDAVGLEWMIPYIQKVPNRQDYKHRLGGVSLDTECEILAPHYESSPHDKPTSNKSLVALGLGMLAGALLSAAVKPQAVRVNETVSSEEDDIVEDEKTAKR